MPADYSSTARALSLPISPERSPERSFKPIRPPWSQTRSESAGRRGSTPYGQDVTGFRDDMIRAYSKLQKRVIKTVKSMTPLQRVLAAIALVILATLGILFLAFNEKIFGWLEPFAEKWKHTTGGWTILWILTFITAFPPIIGYGTCGTTAGFVYGVWEGWAILASASVVGSTCSLIVSRTVLRKYVERLLAHDNRFAALALTIKHDGLKLLCMIRLCPLPYSLSNGAMSTFPTVHPLMYAAATAIVSPKLLIHVFIGSRLAAIAKSGEQMSTGTKIVNWASILGGAVIGAFTGWYIYKRTVARAKELEAEERANVRQAVTSRGPEGFSDDPDEQTAADTIVREDNVDFFDDGSGTYGYRDEFTDDDDDDVFGRGDGDEEEAIGLHNHRQTSR